MNEYTVEITNVATGEMRATKHERLEFNDEVVVYLWSDGSYSSDCNRAGFWLQAADETDSGGACTEGRYTVRILAADGSMLWTDANPREGA